MRSRKDLILLLFCCATLFSFSQDSIKVSKHKYFDYLLKQNESSQNHLLTASYQYMLSPIGKTFGAQGGIASVGLNFGRLFSQKIIFGLSCDVKLIPGFSTKKISDEFITDFNSNFNERYSNSTDSANANVIKRAINDDDGAFILGNTIFNISLMVSLFPQKYGGILFQVKYGSRGFQVHGVYGNPYINNGANDKVPLGIINNWFYEISFKPYAFFSNSHINQQEEDSYEFAKTIVISFFYEKLNFKSGEFNGTRIEQMVSPEFMKKYGIDNRFGIKLGVAFY